MAQTTMREMIADAISTAVEKRQGEFDSLFMGEVVELIYDSPASFRIRLGKPSPQTGPRYFRVRVIEER